MEVEHLDVTGYLHRGEETDMVKTNYNGGGIQTLLTMMCQRSESLGLWALSIVRKFKQL
jgi:hypothetical protein